MCNTLAGTCADWVTHLKSLNVAVARESVARSVLSVVSAERIETKATFSLDVCRDEVLASGTCFPECASCILSCLVPITMSPGSCYPVMSYLSVWLQTVLPARGTVVVIGLYNVG